MDQSFIKQLNEEDNAKVLDMFDKEFENRFTDGALVGDVKQFIIRIVENMRD